MFRLTTYISADSHMVEPADLWVRGLPEKYRDRAPRIYFDEGKQGLFFGGGELTPRPVPAFFAAGKSAEQLADVYQGKSSPARPGGYDPAERLKDMAVDSVAAEVLYTSLAMPLFSIEDPVFQEAIFAAYNDWLADFCSYAPQRFAGLGLISLYNVENGVAELRRIRTRGLRGAMIWSSAPDDLSFLSPRYDPFWATAQDLDVPISLHLLTGLTNPIQNSLASPDQIAFLRRTAGYYEIQRSLGELIFGGVFDRFPNLKVVSAENGIGWIPYFLNRLDYSWGKFRYANPLSLKQAPIDYFRRNIWATFIADPVGLREVDLIGADRILWSNDYPHTDSTWPRSLEVIERDFVGVSAEDTAKICRDNAASLYGFDLAVLEAEPLPAVTAG